MGLVSYSVTAPGSLMLFGEHAVLHGNKSLVAAINRYVKVTLIPRSDNSIRIISKLHGDYVTSIGNFRVVKKYAYVLTAIKQHIKKIKEGFDLKIQTDFPDNIGFGSSAAVTVATLGVLNLWLRKKSIDSLSIYRQGLKVVRSVQKMGSGADIAASVFGGVVSYSIKPTSIKRIADYLPLVVVYSGSKMKTKEVVAKVEFSRKKFPKIYSGIFRAIDLCSKEAVVAIKKKDWKRMGGLMNIHQGLQHALGTNNQILSELVFSLCNRTASIGGPVIYGAKISGSGLGDSVIGLGKIKKNSFPENKLQKKIGVKQIEVSVSKKGLYVISQKKRF